MFHSQIWPRRGQDPCLVSGAWLRVLALISVQTLGALAAWAGQALLLTFTQVDTDCVSTDMTGMSLSAKKDSILLSAKGKSLLLNISNNGITRPRPFAVPISSLTSEHTAREKDPACPPNASTVQFGNWRNQTT